MAAKAQDRIKIDQEEITSWFERNWMPVAAGILVLLVIAIMGRRRVRGTRKTTTVIKDAGGKAQQVTVTEEKI